MLQGTATDFTLKEFVDQIGSALEFEDKKITAIFALRGYRGGLFKIFREQYLQFVTWQAAIKSWDARLEIAKQDLILAETEDVNTEFARIEMKRYWSVNGRQEITTIKKDLDNLVKSTLPVGIMLVFSINVLGETDKYIQLLEADVQMKFIDKHVCSFETMGPKPNERLEFWVAGWLIKDTLTRV